MFIIIWRGLGWLVAVIVFGFSLGAQLAFNALYGDGYYENHKWPLALSLFVSAVTCWFLGSYLKTRSDWIVVDKQTGNEMAVNQSQHTLFFIPMHLWGPVLALGAVVGLVSELAPR